MLLPEFLDDWVSEENPVRAIEAVVDALDLAGLGFEAVTPAATGRGRATAAPLLGPSQLPGLRPEPMCTPSVERRISRWEHEHLLEAMQDRLDRKPDAMRIRRATVEHPFGTMKAWMVATHFRTRTLAKVSTEMSPQILAYNLRRVIELLGVRPLIAAIQA